MSVENNFHNDHDEYGEIISSKSIRAGKRTYFIDVKATQGDDYYLVITESRRRTNSDGSYSYSRHHMYLYKEDFGKFMDGLHEMVDFVKTKKPEYFETNRENLEE